MTELQSVWNKISTKMYEQSEQSNQDTQNVDPESTTEAEDVDFEEVKD